ncbi:MAG: hypothetical protein ACE5G9_03875 [Nitrospinales bacterium]
MAVFLFALAPNLYALSLGPIKVKSNFGERFDAEIDLTAEEEGNIKVAIGTQKDYDMLRISRMKIVDKLRIDDLVNVGRGKEIIKIKSDIPLFFPSFDLVVRVSQNEGTLLENYLITVDFRQMVSLGVHVDKKKQKKKQRKKSVKKPVDLLKKVQTSKPVAVKRSGKRHSVQQVPEAISPKDVIVSRNPRPPRIEQARKAPIAMVTASVAQREKSVLSQAVIPPIPVIVPSKKHSSVTRSLQTISPKSFSRLALAQSPRIDGRREMRNTPVVLSESKKALGNAIVRQPPKPPVALKTAKVTGPLAESKPKKALGNATVRQLPKPPVDLKTSSKTSKTYGPLTEGETVSKIVAKLKMDSAGEARVTVAIWMDNLDRFIGGNIHGIKKGVILSLENVQNRLRRISGRMARMILLNHWREWKIIKKKLSQRFVKMDDQPSTQEVLLPAEKISDKAKIFSLLERWRQSWENEEIDRHMACFSKGFRIMKADGKDLQFADWKEFKLRMFKRYNNVTIRIHRPKLIQMGDRLLASFHQSFDSDKLHSFGHKTLELVRESGEWKIVNERFKSRPRAERNDMSSFVVLSSSHAHFEGARGTVNKLREKGLNAYLSPLNLTPRRIIYRVYVERFSEWALAAQMARFLRAWEFSRYAIPTPTSFSLLAGSFEQEAQAAEKIDFLRKNGISALLFSTSNENFSSPMFDVMVGAYGQENEAYTVKRRLAELESLAD